MDQDIEIRTAVVEDLPELEKIRPPAAIHRDRLRDVDDQIMLYLVVTSCNLVVGFGTLVFAWPSTWPSPDSQLLLPMMVDLEIRPDYRGRGAGTQLIGQMESLARERGKQRIYVAVDPVDNKDALRLYRRLGYNAVQATPYRSRWSFTDSDGNLHNGEEWQIDLWKSLIGQ
jgi:GNAT superfamily N-acetyltransferase